MEALRSSWIHTLKLQVTDFFFHEGLDAKYGNACMLSCFSYVQLFATLWTIARQAPLSLGFSTQEYWTGLPCPPPGDLPNPGIEPMSLKYGNTYLLSMGMLLLLSRFSRVRLCATPQMAAHQAPPSMGFSRKEYWSGVPLPSLKYGNKRY